MCKKCWEDCKDCEPLKNNPDAMQCDYCGHLFIGKCGCGGAEENREEETDPEFDERMKNTPGSKQCPFCEQWHLSEECLCIRAQWERRRHQAGTPFADRYREEIDRFFREEDFSSNDAVKGHIWIAGRGRTFQALTIEPPEGGQYEIAVRFKLETDSPQAQDKFSGYISRDGYIVGRNTDGH